MSKANKPTKGPLPMDPVNISYKDFSIQDIAIVLEILSIFDNRHDFKESGRNKSLTIDEVLQLLKDKSDEIRKKITNMQSKKKQELNEFLDIHCEEVKRHTFRSCGTTVNPDKIVEDYMYEKIFQETPIRDKKRIPYTGKYTYLNHNHVLRFESKEDLASACKCEINDKEKVIPQEGVSNEFLDKLLASVSPMVGVNPEKIRFCIDVSSIGEWVFRHDGLEDPPRTHLKTIADDYDCFSVNPERTPLPTSFKLENNHVILEAFNFLHTKEDDQITWTSQTSKNTPINLERTQRAGVTIMAEAIRLVLSKKKSDAVKLVQYIFNLPYTGILPKVYGKHIMDFKRLMDMSKLAITLLYNSLPYRPYYVILVTHDHMLFLLAKLVGCPVILTMKNIDSSRELLFDIPVSEEYARKYQEERKEQFKEYLKDFPDVSKERVDYPIPKDILTQALPTNPEDIFYRILYSFVAYLNNSQPTYKIPTQFPDKPKLLKEDAHTYIRLVSTVNAYIANLPTPLEDKVNRLINILNDTKINKTSTFYLPVQQTIKLLKELRFVPQTNYDAKKDITKEVKSATRFQPAQFKSIKFGSTKFYNDLTKLAQTGAGMSVIDTQEINNYALDLLYYFIDKNIERYQSLPLPMQLRDYEPELDELIKRYQAYDKQSKTKSRKVLSAPAAIAVPEQQVMKMSASHRGQKRLFEAEP